MTATVPVLTSSSKSLGTASLDALVHASGLYPHEGNEMQIFSNQHRFFSNQLLGNWLSELLDTDSPLLQMD